MKVHQPQPKCAMKEPTVYNPLKAGCLASRVGQPINLPRVISVLVLEIPRILISGFYFIFSPPALRSTGCNHRPSSQPTQPIRLVPWTGSEDFFPLKAANSAFSTLFKMQMTLRSSQCLAGLCKSKSFFPGH